MEASTRRCCAPSWRSRSTRRRTSSAVARIRARDARISWEGIWARPRACMPVVVASLPTADLRVTCWGCLRGKQQAGVEGVFAARLGRAGFHGRNATADCVMYPQRRISFAPQIPSTYVDGHAPAFAASAMLSVPELLANSFDQFREAPRLLGSGEVATGKLGGLDRVA